MKALFLTAALGLLLAGCGATGFGPGALASPSPSPAASPSPGLGFAVVVTEKDQVATLRTGQRLLITLHAAANMRLWSQPQSSDPSIVKPVFVPAMVPQGETLAAFQAVAPGEAQITAISGPSCVAGQACPMYAILYSLRVSVTA